MDRVLERGSSGRDVAYALNLLHRNRFGDDFYPYSHSDPATVNDHEAEAFICAKWFLGYPAKLINESFGTQLEKYLLGPLKHGDRLPPLYLLRRASRLKASSPWRWRIVRFCEWAEAHEPSISYSLSRPFGYGRHLPFSTDCSGYVGRAYEDAGNAPDPYRKLSASAWAGFGNTDSLLLYGKHIAMSALKPGDVVVFGDHHAAVVKEPGKNPLLSSHGSDAGPLSILLSAELRAQNYLTPSFLSFG